LLHLISHFLGIDTQQSPYYDFWSGFAASGAAWIAILVAWFVFRAEQRLERISLDLERRSIELEERLLDLETKPKEPL
jgi:hypothetical protein